MYHYPINKSMVFTFTFKILFFFLSLVTHSCRRGSKDNIFGLDGNIKAKSVCRRTFLSFIWKENGRISLLDKIRYLSRLKQSSSNQSYRNPLKTHLLIISINFRKNYANNLMIFISFLLHSYLVTVEYVSIQWEICKTYNDFVHLHDEWLKVVPCDSEKSDIFHVLIVM